MNDITALRTRLFATLDALQDKENPMDIDRAKAVNETAQVIINSAKVEVDFARATGAPVTGFLEGKKDPKPGGKSVTNTQTGQATSEGVVTVHKIRG